ncbi:hypothetical protein KHA90_01515 [Flavobacterium psychroterrae]|jgi:hypothetical protein|uniref:Uncharacterized protein n=1 Tax=Flavobacterium psychroterrae TaxID=2133767 RepID=A0ABS5P747_9FLAO|nr:hypothetical protein [Flavobacterium psychroterrae]MBS7229688.1 hypothetical protein [Flavobacterium psychroterrae]
MFKRNFKEEFDFFESSFLYENESESKEFDRSIFVIYDKFELMEFLALDKKGSNVLICLFNKQLYDSLFFLEEAKNLNLLDCNQTRIEMIKELKLYFNWKCSFVEETPPVKFPISKLSTKYNSFYKALFSIM